MEAAAVGVDEPTLAVASALTAASMATIVTGLNDIDAALERQVAEEAGEHQADESHASPARETARRAAGARIIGARGVLVRVFGAVIKVPFDAAHARHVIQRRLRGAVTRFVTDPVTGQVSRRRALFTRASMTVGAIDAVHRWLRKAAIAHPREDGRRWRRGGRRGGRRITG